MSTGWKSIALTAALAALAGGVGAWGGATWVLKRDARPSLHEIVHEDLKLNPDQLARIQVLEADFATRRVALEQEVQAANRELAQAIAASNGDSRVVQPAVDHFHDVMGELQQATIAHIFQMRAVMTPTQAERFDRSVVEALTAEGA